ncbi:10112_t:CDS:2, partial [Racocetra fulgida]
DDETYIAPYLYTTGNHARIMTHDGLLSVSMLSIHSYENNHVFLDYVGRKLTIADKMIFLEKTNQIDSKCFAIVHDGKESRFCTAQLSNDNTLSNLTPTLAGGNSNDMTISGKLQTKLKLIEAAEREGIIDPDRAEHFRSKLPYKPEFTNQEIFELKKRHTPITKVMLHEHAPLINNPSAAATPTSAKPISVESLKVPIHLPPVNAEYLNHYYLDRLKLAEEREKFIPNIGYTEQFDDTKPFTAVFPHHSNKDEATFWWSIRERLNFMSPTRNNLHLKKTITKILGSQLFESFLRAIPLRKKIEFDEALYIQKIEENANKRLHKSLATLLNITDRADTHWPDNFADIFIKSQVLKKLEKMWSNAKAGQTLASLHEFAIYMIGPVVRMVSHYLHTELKEMEGRLDDSNPLPGDRYLFILGTNDPNKMEKFVQSHWKDTECLANDYTKYDQSQNHEFLHFEDLLHHHLGAETYDYNTIGNIAYTFLNFIIPTSMPSMFSGDD